MVSREQAKTQLQAVGVENPTEEQITAYLNNVNAEAIKEKAKADQLKEKAGKADELQTQLDTLQNQNLTDSEKLQKQIEALQQQNADLTANNFKSEAKAILSKAGITDDAIDSLLPGMVAGLDNVEDVQTRANAYVTAMNKFRDDAIAAHDKEVLDGTQTPGAGGSGGDDKTEDVKMAEDIAKSFDNGSKEASEVFKNY